MKIALPIWNQRVSPVFDAAQRLVVIRVEEGRFFDRQERDLALMPLDKVRALTQAEVSVLICGAISSPLAMQIHQAGVNVVGNICGLVDQVVEAFLCGKLNSRQFLMPGCCRQRRRFRACRRQNKEW